MALTESYMLPIGTHAPYFKLPDVVSKNLTTMGDVRGTNGTLVMFICNHCPYVIHINQQLVELAQTYMPKGIGFVAISSNDAVNYPEDAPDKMALISKVLKYPFPYLYDESQDVAKSFHAECTPDFFLFDKTDKLVYRGRLDGSRPGNSVPVTGSDLRFAMESVIYGFLDISPQMPSAGCNIKWKK